MKRKFLMILAFAASGTVASAAETAPGDVVFADGAVAASLTGVPGNAENGREIVANKGLGNCIACHQVTDLANIPFQGEIGPVLDGAGARWDEAELRGIIVNAKMTFAESVMPSFYRVDGFIRPGNGYTGEAPDATFGPLLSAQQVEDVVAYLGTLTDYH